MAQTAASRLRALPEACGAAKRYLKKSGLGTRFSRAKILRALRRLKAKPLPRRVARFAKALHLSNAKMRRLVRRAKSVPKAHITAMGVSDLICDPRLAAIDGSLAKAFQKLASGL